MLLQKQLPDLCAIVCVNLWTTKVGLIQNLLIVILSNYVYGRIRFLSNFSRHIDGLSP